MGAFHAYDIRGVYNVDFDKDIAYKVGYSCLSCFQLIKCWSEEMQECLLMRFMNICSKV